MCSLYSLAVQLAYIWNELREQLVVSYVCLRTPTRCAGLCLRIAINMWDQGRDVSVKSIRMCWSPAKLLLHVVAPTA